MRLDFEDGHVPKRRFVPPDPGGRSRILLWILLGVIVAALVALVVLLLALRGATQPPTPRQVPTNQSSVLPHGGPDAYVTQTVGVTCSSADQVGTVRSLAHQCDIAG